jgi:iron complex outermembrane receptor protein
MVPAPARTRAPARLPSAFGLVLLLALTPAPASAEQEPPPEPTIGDVAPDDTDPPPDPAGPVVRVPEVTVTSTRTEQSVLDVPGNVTVIDRETIERSGVETVPDLLRREAGIFVTNTTGNPEGFSVEARGFNNGGGNGSSTLVLVDGRRVNEPSSSVADWSFIPLDNVERIEVVRGPVSAAHGDNALAGVIHIITRHPEEEGVRATLRGRTGTYDTEAGSLLLEGKAGAVSASAFLDDYKTHAYRDRADFRAKTGELDLRFDLGGLGRAGVKGGYATSLRQRPGDLTPAQIEEDRRQPEPGSEANADTARQRYLQGLLELTLGEHVTARFVPYARRRTDSTTITDPFTRFATETDSDVLGLDSQIQIDFEVAGHANRFVVGGDLMQEDVDNDSLLDLLDPLTGEVTFTSPSSDRNRRKTWGVFLQNELALTEDLLLSLGVRRDRARYRGRELTTGVEVERRLTAWAPRAALTWRVAEPVSVYASYSRGFRFPNLDEAFGFFGFAPGLEPEKSDAYETGVKVRSERVTLNLALYTMNVQDEILFNPFAPNPLFLDPSTGEPALFGINANIDRVRHRGVELFASVRPLPWLEIYGSYTYDDVKFARDEASGLEGNRMPLVPRHRGTAGARVLLPCGFEAGVNANYVGSRYVANDLRNGLEKLPKFASYDARIAWKREIADWLVLELELTGHNLTDRRYNEFGGRSAFAPVVGFFPSPDRHYVAGARVTVMR